MFQNIGMHKPVTPLIRLVLPLFVLSGLFIWQLTGLLKLSDGAFSYTLDDAYIHLALSENILKGHYGVNLQDYSAPSSSILWSFLMAPLASWHYWPLFVNVVLSIWALLLWSKHIEQCFPAANTALIKFILNTGFIFLANLIGISFSGMENLLQLVMSMTIMMGIFNLIENKKNSVLFLVAIILAPSVRYESITLSGTALVFMILNRQIPKALVTGFLMVFPLIAFSLYLHSLGLGYLPSSISSKSSAMQSSALTATLLNFEDNVDQFTGYLLLTLMFPLLWHGFTKWRTDIQIPVLAIFMTLAVFGHLFLGRLGNWGRYEIYILISLYMTLLYCFKAHLTSWLENKQFPPAVIIILITLFCVLLAKRYWVTSTMSNLGGANIALQQFQMHRFAVDYWKDDVAVNDLGWVSYKNDKYVLDLWGLANKEALDMRKAETPHMLEKLTTKYHIKLVMIYRDWFPEIPHNWIEVATLHLPDDMQRMTPADSKVNIYATDAAYVDSIQKALHEFEKGLPSERLSDLEWMH